MVRVKLEDLAGLRRRENRRRDEHPVADPGDLDDDGIRGHGADKTLERCDHAQRRPMSMKPR